MHDNQKVTVTLVDEFRIELLLGASPADIISALEGREGYSLREVTPLLSGHQRDQYCIGMKLVFRRA